MIKEDAAAGAVSATAVAAVPRRMGKVKRVVPMSGKKKAKKKMVRESSFSAYLKEFAGDFNPSDVIGQLAQNAKVSDGLDGDGIATYGLELDDGHIVKVLVAREQAKDFEVALGDALADQNGNNSQQDIAELLFDLNDRFHIVDVVWPTIKEDEEEQPDQNQDPAMGDDAMGGPEGDMGGMDDPEGLGGPEDDLGGPDAGGLDAPGGDGDMSGIKDSLAQIVDFLRSDAEARKADAEARTADAKAREAEAAARASEVKLKGEEEILDAEAFYRDKKEQKKEADRLKMLARYRQEMKMSDDTDRFDKGSNNEDSLQMDMEGSSEARPTRGANEDEERTTMIRKRLLQALRGGV